MVDGNKDDFQQTNVGMGFMFRSSPKKSRFDWFHGASTQYNAQSADGTSDNVIYLLNNGRRKRLLV